MNLRPLQYFVVLAEELSASRAAERPHVARPSLSRRIRNLVGRGRRPLRHTEAARGLCSGARQTLASYEKTEPRIREIGSGMRRPLAIGFTRSSMYSVAPATLNAVRRAYPPAELELSEMARAA